MHDINIGLYVASKLPHSFLIHSKIFLNPHILLSLREYSVKKVVSVSPLCFTPDVIVRNCRPCQLQGKSMKEEDHFKSNGKMHQNEGNCINFFQIFLEEDPQTPCQNMSYFDIRNVEGRSNVLHFLFLDKCFCCFFVLFFFL